MRGLGRRVVSGRNPTQHPGVVELRLETLQPQMKGPVDVLGQAAVSTWGVLPKIDVTNLLIGDEAGIVVCRLEAQDRRKKELKSILLRGVAQIGGDTIVPGRKLPWKKRATAAPLNAVDQVYCRVAPKKFHSGRVRRRDERVGKNVKVVHARNRKFEASKHVRTLQIGWWGTRALRVTGRQHRYPDEKRKEEMNGRRGSAEKDADQDVTGVVTGRGPQKRLSCDSQGV